jgi:hypothetical protein
MTVETLIKRTIYVSKCPKCNDSVEKTDRGTRERQCKCGEWMPYVETSYTGTDIKTGGKVS